MAVHHVLAAVVEGVAGEASASLAKSMLDHFENHGDILERSLAECHDRSWRVVELSLGGATMWSRLSSGASQAALVRQIEAFAQDHPLGRDDENRRYLLAELRTAKRQGLLSARGDAPGGRLSLGREVATAIEQRALPGGDGDDGGPLADWQATCPELVRVVSQPMNRGEPPLIVSLCRTLFVLKLQSDERLRATVDFVQAERLAAEQSSGFEAVHEAMETLGEDLTQQIDAQTEQIVAAVQVVGQQVASVQEDVQALRQEVAELLQQQRLTGGAVTASQSFSIRHDGERQAIKALLSRFRELPEPEQCRLPELLNDLGKLQYGAGDADGAEESFEQAAASSEDTTLRAEAHYNAYRACLEQKDYAEALDELKAAAELEPQRYAPFPRHKYTAKRILGAGGFGTAFLCRHEFLGQDVVIKALHAEDLERDSREVFREAQVLAALKHPAIIDVMEVDFADPAAGQRPYLVMPFFPGRSLQDQLDEAGCLSVPDALAVFGQIAEGMRAAHGHRGSDADQAGVLHRDLKPDNVLVHRDGDGSWQVKLIDFGLALKQRTVQHSVADGSTNRSILGSAAAGTLKFAPPEQTGERPDVQPGPYSDVYAFGKTLSVALFGVTEPRRKHLSSVPEPLADLVEDCIAAEPAERPQDFDTVHRRLESLTATSASSSNAPPPTPTAAAAQSAPTTSTTATAPPRPAPSTSTTARPPVAPGPSHSPVSTAPRPAAPTAATAPPAATAATDVLGGKGREVLARCAWDYDSQSKVNRGCTPDGVRWRLFHPAEDDPGRPAGPIGKQWRLDFGDRPPQYFKAAFTDVLSRINELANRPAIPSISELRAMPPHGLNRLKAEARTDQIRARAHLQNQTSSRPQAGRPGDSARRSPESAAGTPSGGSRTRRNPGPLLIIGIVLMPWLFAWFTLQSGYSRISRVLAFGWFLLMVLVWLAEVA